MKMLLISTFFCLSLQVFAQKMNIKPEYNFSATLKYEMSSSLRQNHKTSFKYLLPTNNEEFLGIELADVVKQKVMSRSVFDLKSKAMLMVMQDQQTAMVIPMDIEKMNDELMKNPKYKMSPMVKTGKTKIILGNMCEEWTSEGEDKKSSMWVSPNLNLPTKGLYEMMQNSLSKLGQAFLPAGMKGFPLEIDTTTKSNGEVFTMACVEINSNAPSKISTDGLKVVGN